MQFSDELFDEAGKLQRHNSPIYYFKWSPFNIIHDNLSNKHV